MSRPVAVSRIPRRLIRGGKRTALVSGVASEPTASHRFRGVLFPNLFQVRRRDPHLAAFTVGSAPGCASPARGHQGCVICSAGRPEITILHGPLAISRCPPLTMSVTEGTRRSAGPIAKYWTRHWPTPVTQTPVERNVWTLDVFMCPHDPPRRPHCALPDDPTARTLRRQTQRSPDHPRTNAGTGDPATSCSCPSASRGRSL